MSDHAMRMLKLFAGYESARGSYDVKPSADPGKKKGRAFTVHQGAKEEHWQAHIEGHGPGLGIIPLLSDDTVRWACIDIDVYNLDHSALENEISGLNLPLVICRSKSGGAHLFLFLKSPLAADVVMARLGAWAALLGYGGSEIFPKQSSRYDENDVGNWLNMPYFNADNTMRYGIKHGEPLELCAFLDLAERTQVEGELPSQAGDLAVDGRSDFVDGPPCLQALRRRGGFPDGTRNEGMFNAAVYLRKRFPDGWQDKLQEYNVAMSDPPLTLPEVQVIAKSVAKKDYGFRCAQPPIAPYCDKRTCMGRTFGVSNGRTVPELGHLTKHIGDPVLWFTEIDGTRMMFTTEELHSQNLFQRKVMDAISRVPPSFLKAQWERILDEAISKADIVEVPEEATPFGQFRFLVEQYLTGFTQAKTKAELATRLVPYRTDNGEIWFRSRGLLNFLNNQGFRIKSEHHVWQMLKELGARSSSQRLNPGRSNNPTNIWIMPAPDIDTDVPPIPEFGTTEF